MASLIERLNEIKRKRQEEIDGAGPSISSEPAIPIVSPSPAASPTAAKPGSLLDKLNAIKAQRAIEQQPSPPRLSLDVESPASPQRPRQPLAQAPEPKLLMEPMPTSKSIAVTQPGIDIGLPTEEQAISNIPSVYTPPPRQMAPKFDVLKEPSLLDRGIAKVKDIASSVMDKGKQAYETIKPGLPAPGDTIGDLVENIAFINSPVGKREFQQAKIASEWADKQIVEKLRPRIQEVLEKLPATPISTFTETLTSPEGQAFGPPGVAVGAVRNIIEAVDKQNFSEPLIKDKETAKLATELLVPTTKEAALGSIFGMVGVPLAGSAAKKGADLSVKLTPAPVRKALFNVIAQRPTIFKQWLAKAISPGSNVLKRMGPIGKLLNRDLTYVTVDSEVNTALSMNKFTNLYMDGLEEIGDKNMLPAVHDSVAQFLDKDTPLPKNLPIKVKDAALKMKEVMKETGDRAEKITKAVGHKIKDVDGTLRDWYQRKNFFYRLPDTEVLHTPKGLANEIAFQKTTKAVQDLAEETGKTVDEAATKVAEWFRDRGTTEIESADLVGKWYGPRKISSSLQYARRFDIQNFIKDPIVAIERGLSSFNRSLARLEKFGSNDIKLRNYIDRLDKSGMDGKLAYEIAEASLGLNPEKYAISDVTKMILGAHTFLGMELSQIRNAPQGIVNSWLRSGSIAHTLMGMQKAVTKAGWARAADAGVISKSHLDKYYSNWAGSEGTKQVLTQKLAKWQLRKTGFVKTEEANRVISALAGEDYIRSLVQQLKADPADKAIRQELFELGFNTKAIINNNFTVSDKELLRGMHNFVRQTQFSSDPLSLPQLAYKGGAGRALYQFKSFSLGQGNLIKEMMKRKPISTPMRLYALSYLAGETTTPFGAWVRGSTYNKDGNKYAGHSELTPSERLVEGFHEIGGLGVISDVVRARRQGSAGILRSLVGPHIQMAAEGIYAGSKAVIDKEMFPAQQLGRRQIPFIGNRLAKEATKQKQKSSKTPNVFY